MLGKLKKLAPRASRAIAKGAKAVGKSALLAVEAAAKPPPKPHRRKRRKRKASVKTIIIKVK